MVDISTLTNVQDYTPRTPTAVDALAEVRRIAEQTLRGNPLVNGFVPKGLLRWRGNYGGEFMWIGEFNPPDLTKSVAQRGVSIVRDDPQQQSAFAMYDWNQQPGAPLRQKVITHDADGRTTWREGSSGGQSFPRFPVAMGIANPMCNNTSSTSVCWGRSQLVARHVEFFFFIKTFAQWPVTGAPGFANVEVPLYAAAAVSDLRVTWNFTISAGGTSVATANQVIGPSGTFVSGTLDLGGGSGPWDARADYMVLDFNAWITAGAANRNGFLVSPIYVHNYTIG